MDAQFYWDLFCETGAPEIYVLYQKSLRRTRRKRRSLPHIVRKRHVFENGRIVLRETEYQEADKLLTVLSREHGK